MSRGLHAGLALLMAACLCTVTCIPFDEAREEFCENADPGQERALCGTSDGGPTPDGGPDTDGGTDAGIDAGIDAGSPTCRTASDCPAPSGPCLQPQATCEDGRCIYVPQDDETPCSGTPADACHESTGQCRQGVCVLSPRTTGTCEDGDACTDNDACNGTGACVGTPRACNQPPSQCHEPTGTCSQGACSYVLRPPSSSCDDGDPCTDNDACDGSGACHGTPRTCATPPSQCHEAAGVCTGGACAYPVKASSASCDDGNACTNDDHCDGAGACGGTPKLCDAPPSQCHESAGTCSNGACSYAFKSSSASCDDGNACTDGDHCDGAGGCGGSPKLCNAPPSQCHESTGTCSSGACTYAPKPRYSSCTDADACTSGDFCDGSGACVSGDFCQDRFDECLQLEGCSAGGCQYRDRCGPNRVCLGGACCPIGDPNCVPP